MQFPSRCAIDIFFRTARFLELNMEKFYVAFDDTDSIKGMCTTYLGALLADELSRFASVEEARLIRLNPNIEWKTRGNASVCIVLKTRHKEKAKKRVLEAIERFSVFEDENTNPGAVFFEGEVPREFNDFYRRCLHRVVEIEEAEKLAENYGAECHRYKNGRGIVGALAAIGSEFEDRTYEVIAYRARENWGTQRRINPDSVYAMDARTYPLTFNNVDYAEKRVLITPHSPCPVLFGIRGESPEILKQAFEMIKPEEKIERAIVYKTNQCTDAHLEDASKISEIAPYSSVIVRGMVTKEPRVINGGHVIFAIGDDAGEIECAAYEPTRDFRWIVKKLRPGDEIRAYGGVRKDRNTINLEKIHVLKLAKIYEEQNPLCDKCGKRMESAGVGQGFRCRRCKTKAQSKITVEIPRQLEEKIYSVPPGAMRHLSKPLVRF